MLKKNLETSSLFYTPQGTNHSMIRVLMMCGMWIIFLEFDFKKRLEKHKLVSLLSN
jgi:hypothetical protein